MRYALLFAGIAIVLSSCAIGEFAHGARYERKTGRVEGESPYMPTIHDEEQILKKKLKNWQEIHADKQGLVGYLLTQENEPTDSGKRRTIYYIYDLNSDCIGFYTENGETYRLLFDNYRQTKEMIGHYEPEESCMHLLKCKNPCEFKPLSTKPPK